MNVTLFALQGVLVERVLGAGRTALLTFTSLAIVSVLLGRLLVGGSLHGASGMTWSYVLFTCQWLVLRWRNARWHMLRDWRRVLVHSDHFDEVVDEAPHRDQAMNGDPRASRYPVRQPRVRCEPALAELHEHRVTRLLNAGRAGRRALGPVAPAPGSGAKPKRGERSEPQLSSEAHA